MATANKINGEKLQYDVNKETAKISALPSCKNYIYEYLKVKKYYLLIRLE